MCRSEPACTKTQNKKTKQPKRNDRNDRNDQNDTKKDRVILLYLDLGFKSWETFWSSFVVSSNGGWGGEEERPLIGPNFMQITL